MGPWLCSHGNTYYGTALALVCDASMGPWLCSHGNERQASAAKESAMELQWGRGCVATEI